MENNFFFPAIPVILGLSFVALIALGVSALQDAKHGAGKAATVKRVYVYIVTFLTLLLIGASVISLLDTGLRASAFRKADPILGVTQSPPPGLYLPFKEVDGTTPVVAPTASTLTCTDGCTLTQEQKDAVAAWESQYQTWRDTERDSTTTRARALVTPISFLIVALVVFIVHWRLVVRDRKTMDDAENFTRSTYFTAMSFIWLITSVIAAGFLLNTVLRSVIPGAETTTTYSTPAEVRTQQTEGITSIASCGAACGLSAETVTLAEAWQTDWATWEARNSGDERTSRNRQNNLAIELSFLITALPLFLYHFRAGWRQRHAPPVQSA